MEHATEGRLQAYLDEEMGGAERMALAAHLDVCGPCGRALEEMHQKLQDLTTALQRYARDMEQP